MSHTVRQYSDALKVLELLNERERKGEHVIPVVDCGNAVSGNWPEVRTVLMGHNLVRRVDIKHYAIADIADREAAEGDLRNQLAVAKRNEYDCRLNLALSALAIVISLIALLRD